MENVKVILLGTSEYEDDNIQNIPNVEASITALKEAFTANLGIPKDNIFEFVNLENAETIRYKIDDKLQSFTKTDTLIFYYVGHGFINSQKSDYYWAHKKSLLEGIHRNGVTGILVKTLIEDIKSSKPKQKILIIDACRSGAALNTMGGHIKEVVHTKLDTSLGKKLDGIFAMAAVGEDDFALFPEKEPNSPTYFTQAFLNALKSKNTLTLDQLYAEIYEELEDLGKPLPKKISRNTISEYLIVNKAIEAKAVVPKTNNTSGNDKDDFFTVAQVKNKANQDLGQSRMYFNMALTKKANGEHQEALNLLNKAISLNINDPELYFHRGVQKYFFLGIDDETVVTDFLKVLDFNPKYVKALHNLGIYYYNNEQPSTAIIYYERALAIDPDNYNTLSNLGLAYITISHNKAIDCFKKALKINPKHSISYLHLGDLYKSISKFEQAIDYYKWAIDVDDNNYDAHLNLGIAYSDYNNANTPATKSLHGVSYSSEKLIMLAISELTDAIKLENTDYRAYNALQQIFRDKKSYDIVDYISNNILEPLSNSTYIEANVEKLFQLILRKMVDETNIDANKITDQIIDEMLSMTSNEVHQLVIDSNKELQNKQSSKKHQDDIPDAYWKNGNWANFY